MTRPSRRRLPRRPDAAPLLVVALLLAACSAAPSAASPGGGSMTAPTAAAVSDAPMTDGPSSPESIAPEPSSPAGPAISPSPGALASPGAASPSPTTNPAAEALAARPWATATLTDVTTGETFTVAQLAGKPLFIEAMAIWCTKCREQQQRFTEAFDRLLPGMAEYVVLTIDPSEGAADLARYEASRGFAGRYVVAGRQLARQLEAEFGPNVLNPPSVPLIFVSPTGEIEFRTGPEPVERILERAGA